MVFVAVGQEDGLEFFFVLHEECGIWDHQIDPQHVIIRECQAGIHQDHVIAVNECGHVLANFSQTAQGDDG